MLKVIYRLVPALLACALAVPAQADEDASSNLMLRGFGTLGMARSTSQRMQYVRDLSQPDGLSNGEWSGGIDSMLGVQMDWKASDNLDVVVQGLSALHWDHTFNPVLNMAFVRWSSGEGTQIRAGRFLAEFLMDAEARQIGYSQLSVRQPPDFVGPLFFHTVDGLDLAHSVALGGGEIKGAVFAGRTSEKVYGTPGEWNTTGSPVWGYSLEYQRDAWRWRFNAASVRFANDINFTQLQNYLQAAGDSSAASALSVKDETARFYSVGVAYDDGPLKVSGMYGRVVQTSAVFQDSQSAYVLAGYRLGQFTPYAGASRWVSNDNFLQSHTPLQSLNDTYRQVMVASYTNQTTTTLGLRWDFMRNMAFKAQWDRVNGSPDSVFPYAYPQSGWDGKTDVFSLTLDFVF